MFAKNVSSLLRKKPVYQSLSCIEHSLPQDTILSFELQTPPYQTDLNPEKVSSMVLSYRANPEFGRFKNVIVIAVRMVGTPAFYLVDGQHRVAMMKQTRVEYEFKVLFYPIHSDDEMRHLFRELNYDSHKNLAYVSLGADTARLVDDLFKHYKDKPFTTKRASSRLHTLRQFLDSLSDYIKQFTTLHELVDDLESTHEEFMQNVDFRYPYSEDKDCIEKGFIMPLKECNFIEYLQDSSVIPYYHGKQKTIPLALKKQVWNTHVGIEIGATLCCVCSITTIHQMSFHCGHVIAASRGGSTTVDNLRPICQSCNSSMGNKNLNEFRLAFFKP